MSELHWKKSSYSPDASNCVEIATTPTTIHIRDSKNSPGPQIALGPAAWTGFLSHTAAARR